MQSLTVKITRGLRSTVGKPGLREESHVWGLEVIPQSNGGLELAGAIRDCVASYNTLTPTWKSEYMFSSSFIHELGPSDGGTAMQTTSGVERALQVSNLDVRKEFKGDKKTIILEGKLGCSRLICAPAYVDVLWVSAKGGLPAVAAVGGIIAGVANLAVVSKDGDREEKKEKCGNEQTRSHGDRRRYKRSRC